MGAVAEFAAEGGLVLGICNGFQILCEAGLLPGTLRPNASLAFICRDVVLRVERTDTPFTATCTPGQRLTIPIKHGEGCWFAHAELLAELEARRQIVLRYVDNPNGSVGDVAAVCNERGNVMGLMPHPEHAVDRVAWLGGRRADPREPRRGGPRGRSPAGRDDRPASHRRTGAGPPAPRAPPVPCGAAPGRRCARSPALGE